METPQFEEAYISHVCKQNYYEIREFYSYLMKHRHGFDSILEIGVCLGGTLRIWNALANPGAIVVGIDSFTEFNDSIVPIIKKLQLDLCHHVNPNTNVSVHHGSSIEEEALVIIRSRRWNFIFIDGRHGWEYCSKDFINALQNISVPGIIGLDDVAKWDGTKRLWKTIPEDLKEPLIFDERYNNEFGSGIGIVHIKSQEQIQKILDAFPSEPLR